MPLSFQHSMLETSSTSQQTSLRVVQQANDTTQTPIVSIQQSLSPLDIERVCRAFIQLLTSPHKEKQHGHEKTSAEK